MEHARPYLKAEIVATFADFPPWIHISESLAAWFILGEILFLAPLLLKLLNDSSSPEKNPPEVPDGHGVWTVYKDAFWVRYYHWVYQIYPRDICSYFWRSVMMVVASAISIVSAPFVLVSIISFVLWGTYEIRYGIWRMILATLFFVKLLPDGYQMVILWNRSWSAIRHARPHNIQSSRSCWCDNTLWSYFVLSIWSIFPIKRMEGYALMDESEKRKVLSTDTGNIIWNRRRIPQTCHCEEVADETILR